MRVIAGSARRLILEAPMTKVRPTTDRTKETLFNMINNELIGARVLDLFAGSGALGIESLSRGSVSAVFVDNFKESILCIQKNLKKTKLIEKAQVFQYDYVKACQTLANKGQQFDVIFLDPPYNQEIETKAIQLISEYNLLSENGLIVVESTVNTEISNMETVGFEITKLKEYKTNKFTFIRRKGE